MIEDIPSDDKSISLMDNSDNDESYYLEKNHPQLIVESNTSLEAKKESVEMFNIE